MMSKKQKRTRGDVVKIALGDDTFGYGQVLQSPLFVFFDLKTSGDQNPEVDEIVSADVAFSVWVMDYAVTDGDWPIIGNHQILDAINERPPFFKKDAISGSVSLTYTGSEQEPVELSDLEGIECAAVWDPEHVVDRLNDYFAGKPNKWVDSMKPV